MYICIGVGWKSKKKQKKSKHLSPSLSHVSLSLFTPLLQTSSLTIPPQNPHQKPSILAPPSFNFVGLARWELVRLGFGVFQDLGLDWLGGSSYDLEHMDNRWSRIQLRMSTKVTGPNTARNVESHPFRGMSMRVTGPNTARNSRQYGRSPVQLLGGTLARVTGPNTARNSRQYGRSPVHLLGGTLARVTGPNIARCIALHHISRIVDWLG
ncbi:uncharacterized protein LOC131323025 [Rhododendron vialii]|uniref:uncharacterized protein LOC131323025 n=1 Tax=Rhododendron vialii TaxID=182163 RepID=UPI00265E7519|nr:uncharacterized protein LOC131323025 [Rhododendron vialii]